MNFDWFIFSLIAAFAFSGMILLKPNPVGILGSILVVVGIILLSTVS